MMEAFLKRRATTGANGDRAEKLRLECEKLAVAILIDNERLKQAELETKSQQGRLIDFDEHCRVMDEIRELYCTGLDQIVENVSTKLRNPRAHDVLKQAADDLRRRISSGSL
jgi:hypothetical protein